MRKVADAVVVLSDGKAVYFGPPAEMDKSDDPLIKDFLEMDRVVKPFAGPVEA